MKKSLLLVLIILIKIFEMLSNNDTSINDQNTPQSIANGSFISGNNGFSTSLCGPCKETETVHCSNSKKCDMCDPINFSEQGSGGNFAYEEKEFRLISKKSEKIFWLCSECVKKYADIPCKKEGCTALVSKKIRYCYDHRCTIDTCAECKPGKQHKCGKCGAINHHSDFECTTPRVMTDKQLCDMIGRTW